MDHQLADLPLSDLCSLTSLPSSIDSLLFLSLRSSTQQLDRLHVPARRYLPFVKPGWTPELKRAHSRSKKLYREWVRSGRPRSCSNHKRRRCKKAKAAFRALLRRQQRTQRDAFFSSLDLDSCDPGRLFRQVRRANGGAAEPTTVLRVGETTYTDSRSVGGLL